MTALRRSLSRWSQSHQRDLPWRGAADPYRVWISEIMLQQTTVAAVIPYFQRFLQRFPTVSALAAAEETDVLRLWEGLGYYSRARNLHRAAQTLVTQHGGEFPRTAAALAALPGIGRYTAGAIASFAFNIPAPIVEANTLRLYSRLLGFTGDPRDRQGQTLLWDFAAAIVADPEPGQINQALMDLGATVCTPQAPRCSDCPLKSVCRAWQQDLVAEIPRPALKPQITPLQACSVAIRRRRQFLLRRCQPSERWAGLWDFPRREWPAAEGAPFRPDQMLPEWLREFTGLTVRLGPQLALFRHSVTRYRIQLHCYLAEHVSGRLSRQQEWAWVSTDQLAEYPLSVTGRKFAHRLQEESS